MHPGVEHICDALADKITLVGVGGAMGSATEVDMAAWDCDMKINVTSMVLMARHCILEMRKNGRGAIVNMSSVSGCTSTGWLLSFDRVLLLIH